jgi:hypothetical protein
MYKEQEELVGDAYKNYIYNPDYKAENYSDLISSQAGQLVKCSTQEEFINKCKTDPKFSEKWGLKIEERELKYHERRKYRANTIGTNYNQTEDDFYDLDKYNIPTKLITITYNNKTIESYE